MKEVVLDLTILGKTSFVRKTVCVYLSCLIVTHSFFLVPFFFVFQIGIPIVYTNCVWLAQP